MTVTQAMRDALLWYAVATSLALSTYPIVYAAARGLPDRGWSLARPLGLLLAVVLSWWPAAVGLVAYTNGLIVGAAAVAAIVGWSLVLRGGGFGNFLRGHWVAVMAAECGWFVVFLGYVAFRGYNPDIAHTEKPMDLAFLNSAIRTRGMPPADPWFAGRPINYYYLGYLTMAVPARLSRIAPGVAFNLSLATLFASATVAVAGVGGNLARLAGAGRRRTVVSMLLGPLFLVGIGNLKTPWEFLHHPGFTLGDSWWQGIGWSASRVIVDTGIPGASAPHPTINEFPAFSFVLGDLHPHLLALPILISAIGLAVGLTRQEQRHVPLRHDALPVAAAGAVAGALYAINSWDMPTALLVLAGALVLRHGAGWRARLERLALLAVAAALVALPFAVGYVPSVGSDAGISPRVAGLPVLGTLVRTIGIVDWSRTSAGSLLLVHGLYLSVVLAAVATVWLACPSCSRPSAIPLLAVAGATLLVAALLGFPALVMFGLPALALVVALRRVHATEAKTFPGWLLALGCALILVTEVLYLQDAFGDRMNTVFKVYFQVWTLFAIGSAAALPSVIVVLKQRAGRLGAWVTGSLIGLLVLGAAIYPPLSAYRWDLQLSTWHGIDGLAYIGAANPAEGDAIRWLRTNGVPGSVVLEAPGCSYGEADGLPHDRVSMASGLPTVIGWNFHEYQWRDGIPAELQEIQTRQQAVNQVYRDPTSPQAQQILDRYRVTYIYVGALEERGYADGCTVGPPYPAASLARIAQIGWPVVFHEGDVTIYGRPG